MYKQLETSTARLYKRAIRAGAPEWLLALAQHYIRRGKAYRADADSDSAKKFGMRRDRFTKACHAQAFAADVLNAFIYPRRVP